MDEQTAHIILYAIAAVGGLAWLAGAQYLLGSFRASRPNPSDKETFLLDEGPPEGLIVGSAEVDGLPADLSAKAASVLAMRGIGQIGPVKILQQTDERVVFEGLGRVGGHSGSNLALGSRRGQLHFAPLGRERTRIEYAVERPEGRGLLIAGGIVQFFGLLALIGGAWALDRYVAPNPSPAVRAQVVQMVQVVHLLWPPFLFGWLYRTRGRAAKEGIDALAHNLPFYPEH